MKQVLSNALCTNISLSPHSGDFKQTCLKQDINCCCFNRTFAKHLNKIGRDNDLYTRCKLMKKLKIYKELDCMCNCVT